MKSRRTAILAIILLTALALALALLSPRLLSKKESSHEPTVQPRNHAAVTAKGVVESVDAVVIGSQLRGIIRKIEAREGDSVRKGQALVLLDDAKIAAQVAQTRAAVQEATWRARELESGSRNEDLDMAASGVKRSEAVFHQAEDEFRKLERLYAKDATTRIEKDRAQERMNIAKEELNSAQANLKKLRHGERREDIERARAMLAQRNAELVNFESIMKDHLLTSPLDGVVSERIKDVGEVVDIGTPVMKLIDPRNLRIRVEVEETDLAKVSDRQNLEVVVDAFKGKVYRGKVTRIFPSVQKISQKTYDPLASFDINTITVYATLDDFAGLKDGMTVTVKFLYE